MSFWKKLKNDFKKGFNAGHGKEVLKTEEIKAEPKLEKIEVIYKGGHPDGDKALGGNLVLAETGLKLQSPFGKAYFEIKWDEIFDITNDLQKWEKTSVWGELMTAGSLLGGNLNGQGVRGDIKSTGLAILGQQQKTTQTEFYLNIGYQTGEVKGIAVFECQKGLLSSGDPSLIAMSKINKARLKYQNQTESA